MSNPVQISLTRTTKDYFKVIVQSETEIIKTFKYHILDSEKLYNELLTLIPIAKPHSSLVKTKYKS